MVVPSFLRKVLQKGIWPPGGYGLSLRLSGLTISIGSFLLVAVVAWAFFMGFWVGRGQNPEQTLEQMRAGLAPGKQAGAEDAAKPEQSAAESPSAQEQDSASAATASDRPQAQVVVAKPLSETPGIQVQNPVQLAPSQGAEQRPDARGRKPATANIVKPAQADQPGRKSQKQQTVNDQKQANAKKDKQQQNKKTEKTEPVRSGKPVYDYVYQVAASKSEADAKNLAQKLAGAGQKASISKSGKVWLVLFSLRGTEEDAARAKNSAQATLGKALRGKMLRLSKNEVGKKPEQPASKRRK